MIDLNKIQNMVDTSTSLHPEIKDILLFLRKKIDESSQDNIKIESGYINNQSTDSSQVLHLFEVRKKRKEKSKSTVLGVSESVISLQKINAQRLYLLRIILKGCYFTIWHTVDFIIVTCSYVEEIAV